MLILNIICILCSNERLMLKTWKQECIFQYFATAAENHYFLSIEEELKSRNTQIFSLSPGGSNDMQMKILSIKTKN